MNNILEIVIYNDIDNFEIINSYIFETLLNENDIITDDGTLTPTMREWCNNNCSEIYNYVVMGYKFLFKFHTNEIIKKIC